MKNDPNKLLDDFLDVARIANVPVSREQVEIVQKPAPHERPTVRSGQFVYVFSLDNHCLKVGSVTGSNDPTRLTNHYNPKGGVSVLARSILENRGRVRGFLDPQRQQEFDQLPAPVWEPYRGRSQASIVARWMEKNLTLYIFQLRGDVDRCAVLLLEIFLQCRLRPLFEGRT